MEKVHRERFLAIDYNNGCKRKFKLNAQARVIKSVLFSFISTGVSSTSPLPRYIQLGLVSLLVNNKNNFVMCDYPMIATIGSDGTDQTDRSQYCHNERIPINMNVEKNSFHQFIFKKLSTYPTSWNLDLDVYIYYEE